MSNNLPATSNNALALSTQYPAEKFNVLVPIQTVAEIAEIQSPVMNAVTISTKIEDGEIYEQQRGKYALTRKALLKLMRAAGIRVVKSQSELPSKCLKCAEVNRAIGRPVNCGSCNNKDVKYTVTILAPQLTGQDIMYKASREMNIEEETAGMTPNQKTQFMKFRAEHCESKALNRAIRAALMIKPTYTLEELKKPFVVAYLVPNLNNPEVKARAIDGFFACAQALYGHDAASISQPRVIDVSGDDDDEIPPMIPTTISDPQPSASDDMPGDYPANEPDFLHDPDPNPQSGPCCDACGADISEKVYNYSIDKFGRPLCFNCQKKARGQQ
jgi:hypothetical protein